MGQGFLMGFDLGGGGLRCLLLDPERFVTVVAARACRHPVAPGTGGLGSDLDLDAIWRLLGETARECLERAGARPPDVRGVAVSSMRFATVVLGRGGEPLLATPNRDARAGLEALRLATDHGEALHARTGHWPSPICGAPRLAWLEAARPGSLARAEAVLGLGDWATWRLCGELLPEPTQAPATLLWDVHVRGWAWDWIERLRLPARLFRSVSEAGTCAGRLRPEAAADLGLEPGIPVGVCGADTPAGLLGAGVASAGEIGVIAGTTGPVQLLLDQPQVDAEARLWTEHHLVSDCWALESNAGPTGEALEWLARLLYPDAPRPVSRLLAEASLSEPGAAGLFSSFGGGVMNARDMRLPVGSLTLSHLAAAGDATPRRHLARAVLEGMACALRANLEQVEAVAGVRTTRIRMGGGMSRSPFFAQLLCDVLDRPLEIGQSHETSALGAALCAGVAAGVFPHLPAAAAVAAERARPLAPDPERASCYQEVYTSWCGLHTRRRESEVFASGAMLPAIVAPLGRAPAPQPLRARPRILVTADLDGDNLRALERLGEVESASFRQAMRVLSGRALKEALDGVSVFVTEIDVLDASVLPSLPDLRVVVACRGDAVNVDVDACTTFGIPVLHAPGRNADAVADLTLAFLLALARRLPEASAFLRQPGIAAGDLGRMGQAFRTLRGRELWRKRVGLVGLGAVGRGVARRLAGFGVEILVHDPFVAAEEVEALGATPVSLDTLLASCDFVSLHAPVTDATRGLLDAAALARMKPGAALVNTARAALLDETALAAALREGHLSGAALDVFSVEPPGAGHPLLALPNVIATPHVGGNTEEVAVHQGVLVSEELECMLRGGRPRYVLNPETLDGFRWDAPRAAPDPARLRALGGGTPPAVSDLPPPEEADAAPIGEAPVAGAERMAQVLHALCAGLESDPAIRALSVDRCVSLQFALTDLGLAFFLRLDSGRVRAGLGRTDLPPDVRLRLEGRAFHEMLCGRASGMDLAMKGALSFTGDVARAMTLQHLQGDLQRLYAAACEATGGPGDLECARPPQVGAGPAPMGADDPRRELLAVVGELHATQLITATGGNVSVRAAEPGTLWITPSRLFKGDLRPELLVRIDLDGEPLDPEARSPSSERLMHCAAYRARPDTGAVIHAHALHATILANAGLPFLPISTEAAFFGELPRVPFLMPGTRELAEAVGEALRDSPVVLMQNHGLLVAGRSLRRAADMVEIVERTAQVLLGCVATGRPPPVLPEHVVQELRQMGDLVA